MLRQARSPRLASSLSLVFTSNVGHSIDRFGNRDGENATLTRIESLTPLLVSFRKVGNRAGLALKGRDAPLDGRLRKGQVLNLRVPTAVGYARYRNVNDCAELGVALYVKNGQSRVGLVCG